MSRVQAGRAMWSRCWEQATQACVTSALTQVPVSSVPFPQAAHAVFRPGWPVSPFFPHGPTHLTGSSTGTELQASPHRHYRPGRLPEPSDPPASQLQTPGPSSPAFGLQAAGHLLVLQMHSRPQQDPAAVPRGPPQARTPWEPGIACSSGVGEETEAGPSSAGRRRSPMRKTCRR